MKPIGCLASAFFFTRHVSQTVRHNHHFEFNLDRSLFKFDLLRLPSFAGTQLPRAIRDCYRDFWRARLSPRLFVVFTTFLSRPVKISQSRVLQYSLIELSDSSSQLPQALDHSGIWRFVSNDAD